MIRLPLAAPVSVGIRRDLVERERSRLDISESVVQTVINYHCATATHHEIFFLWRPYLPDSDDDMLLELAVKAGCQFIVTYNSRDFAGIEQFGLQAVTPPNSSS